MIGIFAVSLLSFPLIFGQKTRASEKLLTVVTRESSLVEDQYVGGRFCFGWIAAVNRDGFAS